MFYEKELTDRIISAAIEVHRYLGPGLLESAYEECICHEFKLRGIAFERQKPLVVRYKEIRLNCDYRMDLVANKKVILELKAVDAILPVHEAQLLRYLRLSGLKLGLILNFYVPIMKAGIKRIIL